jgi:amino acid permease
LVFYGVYFQLFTRAIVTEVVLYIAIGFGGYYSLCNADDFPDIFINRDNLHGKTDYFILVSRVVFPLYLAIGIPLNVSPMKAQIYVMLYGDGKKSGQDSEDGSHSDEGGQAEEKQTSTAFHVFWSAVILSVGGTVAYLFPDVISIIGVIGGICCTGLMITFPGFSPLLIARNVLREAMRAQVV